MADDPKQDNRPWWALARVQGLVVMAAGIAMLFNPVTAPHAGTVIAVGAGWATGGTASKLARKIIK